MWMTTPGSALENWRKNLSERRWWTNEKIGWYERASDHCCFHSLLASSLEKYLTPSSSILELGCGTGRMAETLARRGYPILALDNDEEAIRTAKERSGLSIFCKGDYKDRSYSGDTVLTVFFGRFWVDDNLSFLLSMAKRNLVSIHSLHIGQGIKGKDTPSLSRSLSFLHDRGYEAEGIEMEIPFHQPLLSYEEGLEFIKKSYGEDKVSLYESSIEESEDKIFPFEFKNNKKMVILNIPKKELR